jgi:hypothetical protein
MSWLPRETLRGPSGQATTVVATRAVPHVTHAWVTAALEEYKTLRQESLAAIEQMQRTLQIGLVAIGVMTAFGGDAVTKGAGVQVGLALAAPVLAALVAALRLDELHRTVAAGAHAAELEQRIARKVGEQEDPLTWETRVQEKFKRREDMIRHWATLVALFAATAPAIVLGVSEYGHKHTPEWRWLGIGVLLIFAAVAWYQHSKLGEVAELHDTANRRVREMRGAPALAGLAAFERASSGGPQRPAANSGRASRSAPAIESATSFPAKKPGTLPCPE